jgi:hypothetical protein
LSILRRQTNRSAQDRVPRSQLLSPPAMPLLRVSLRYPGEASTVEPRGSEVARAPSIAERMGSLRTPALRGKCEVETCGVDFRQAGIRRHVDHIVPARLIRRLKAGNPDRRENLQCICRTCHGCKLQGDHKLCMGDKLGYLEVLRTHNFDLARVERALALYGL